MKMLIAVTTLSLGALLSGTVQAAKKDPPQPGVNKTVAQPVSQGAATNAAAQKAGEAKAEGANDMKASGAALNKAEGANDHRQ